MKKLYYFILLLFILVTQCKKDLAVIQSDKFIWEVSTPEEQGLNSQILDSAFIQSYNFKFIDALLIIRNGYIVAEQYYNGFDTNTPHNVMSVSKSFLSAIAGVAVQEGYIDSLGEKMLNYFPEYIYPAIDQRKYDITIKHLLTMQMGIDSESENNYAIFQEIQNSPNWIKATIEYQLAFSPGERMRYNTFQTHLLSAIITKATRQSTKDFATEYLFNDLKIDVDNWLQDPQGYYFGGSDMYFTPREMAVLGYLYLKNGKLNGHQVVPENWIELTLSASSNFTHPNQWGDLKNYNYGYLWWLGEISGNELFMALGYGGQFVIVFPNLDLIVVTTSNNQVYPDDANNQELGVLNIIEKYVITSIEGEKEIYNAKKNIKFYWRLTALLIYYWV
jgi:CubicO group peptidase (beta-lactamase class C family)